SRRNHVRYFQHRRRTDRVAFYIDRLLVGGGQHRREPSCERRRFSWRHNREKEIGFGESTVFDRLHAGISRSPCAGFAAANQGGQHRHLVFRQALADAGAHGARCDDGNSRDHEPVTPPSRLMLWPVTKDDASEARNNTAPTRSSGTSARGTHCIAMIRSFWAGVTVLRSISVNVAPGKMAFTVIPSGPSSRAMDRLMPASAALVAM